MKVPKYLKLFCIALMSLMMSNIPAVAFAEAQMISTTTLVNDLTRAQTEQKLQEFLSRSDVRQKLVEKGLSPEEASLRLASLSETELRQLSNQVDQAHAGGDILIAILVVVLIIFLIKRI